MNQTTDSILTRVYKGMSVFDGRGRPVGVVEQVILGGLDAEEVAEDGAVPVAPQVNISGSGASIANIQYANEIQDDLPEELREHLLRSGYLRVRGGGVLAGLYLVTPGQIARVDEDLVRLNLPVEQLVQV